MIVKATVVRTVTDEEQVRFDGEYETDDLARTAVTAQLALCRDHMVQYNEQVRAIDEKKASELAELILARDAELKRLDALLVDAQAKLTKADKRLRAAG